MQKKEINYKQYLRECTMCGEEFHGRFNSKYCPGCSALNHRRTSPAVPKNENAIPTRTNKELDEIAKALNGKESYGKHFAVEVRVTKKEGHYESIRQRQLASTSNAKA